TFVQALLEPGVEPSDLAGQPAFAVYRNTVMSGCIDALEANHPVVAALVGRDWFREVAAQYVRRSPPRDVRLMRYGIDFDEFLSGLPVVAELPFLPAVALMERLWGESHMAADAAVPEAADLWRVPGGSLERLRLVPHPAARWHWFEFPACSLWRAHQAGDERECRAALEVLEWRGEGALLTRPHGRVLVAPASRAACAFLDACGRSAALSVALAAAAESAAGTDAGAAAEGAPFDAPAMLRQLVEAGALSGFEAL